MRKRDLLCLGNVLALALALALAFSAPVCRAADLSTTEQRWLQGIWPVVTFAKDSGLPLDIVAQPQPTPGLPPLAMAFVGGRCKLVLSMRGNPQAQATLDGIDPLRLDVTLELMAAHELGHCQRYLAGLFLTPPPAGFAARGDAARPEPADAAARHALEARRREEGFGDLVGLAWTQRQHPQHFAALHAWLLAERSKAGVAGSDHDTRAWLALAADGDRLAGPSIFSQPARLWEQGLAADD